MGSSNAMVKRANDKIWQSLSLIDVTYKTTRYEIPLFFVSTNVGYCVIADFIGALEMTTVYGCDFHHEQAWGQWISDHKNGLTKDEDDQLLSLLQDCAIPSASSELDLDL